MLNSDKFRGLQLFFCEYMPRGRIHEYKIPKNRKFRTACVLLSDSYTGEGVFQVVFSECIGGYWFIIIDINENKWPDCDWVLEHDGSKEILDV